MRKLVRRPRAANPATHYLLDDELPMAGEARRKAPATACGLMLAECGGYYLTPFESEVNCVACVRALGGRRS
jgi:hypothetical protein